MKIYVTYKLALGNFPICFSQKFCPFFWLPARQNFVSVKTFFSSLFVNPNQGGITGEAGPPPPCFKDLAPMDFGVEKTH